MVYVTRGLLEALLDMALESEPESVSVRLSTTPAGDLRGSHGLAPDVPVFTHLYLPDAGRSLSAVFGVDLATPAGGTDGRFLSHPDGVLGVSLTDDLHGTMLVAVPPWDRDAVAAFGRRGRELSLSVVDAVPPDERLA